MRNYGESSSRLHEGLCFDLDLLRSLAEMSEESFPEGFMDALRKAIDSLEEVDGNLDYLYEIGNLIAETEKTFNHVNVGVQNTKGVDFRGTKADGDFLVQALGQMLDLRDGYWDDKAFEKLEKPMDDLKSIIDKMEN